MVLIVAGFQQVGVVQPTIAVARRALEIERGIVPDRDRATRAQPFRVVELHAVVDALDGIVLDIEAADVVSREEVPRRSPATSGSSAVPVQFVIVTCAFATLAKIRGPCSGWCSSVLRRWLSC